MEAAYEQLKKDGQNNVDNLVKWMKQSKVVEDSAESEAKLRKMFDDAQDKQNIEYSKFQEVVGKAATEQNKTSDQFMKMLLDALPQLQGAVTAAVNAAANAATTAFSSAFSGK